MTTNSYWKANWNAPHFNRSEGMLVTQTTSPYLQLSGSVGISRAWLHHAEWDWGQKALFIAPCWEGSTKLWRQCCCNPRGWCGSVCSLKSKKTKRNPPKSFLFDCLININQIGWESWKTNTNGLRNNGLELFLKVLKWPAFCIAQIPLFSP